MPKGYVIARVDVTDPDAYARYVAAAGKAAETYGGRPLVKGGAYVCLEGDARERNVVMEFESFSQAQAYYKSPEYSAARQMRRDAAAVDLIAVEGL